MNKRRYKKVEEINLLNKKRIRLSIDYAICLFLLVAIFILLTVLAKEFDLLGHVTIFFLSVFAVIFAEDYLTARRKFLAEKIRKRQRQLAQDLGYEWGDDVFKNTD